MRTFIKTWNPILEVEHLRDFMSVNSAHFAKALWPRSIYKLLSNIQPGNVNSEGRISRLIDEWSSEDEAKLGIINDPGTCSVLTTPDVEKFKWADNHNPLDDRYTHTNS